VLTNIFIRSVSRTSRRGISRKRELTLTYTVTRLIEEFPSLAHLIKVIPGKVEASFLCGRFGCGTRVNGDSVAIAKHGQKHLVRQAGGIKCLYGRCTTTVAVQDLVQHVEAHLQSNGARCGVCNDWFADADLATKHLTQPCPTLVYKAGGYSSPSKRARQIKH
jgi:hypothetical protein